MSLLRRFGPYLLGVLAVALMVLTVHGNRQSQGTLVAAHDREAVAQRLHIDRLTRENARLQTALTGLARRPERARALVAEADLEEEVLGLINADREALGRQALQVDPQLAFLARWRASDLHTREYYSHTFPEGGNIGTLLASYGGFNTVVGENLWSCASWLQCSAADLHRAFVESPGHKANQEDPRYDHVGVGVSVSPDGDTFVVELFSIQSVGYRAPRP